MIEPEKPKGIFICSASHFSDGSDLTWTGKIWVCQKETKTGACLHSLRKVCSFSKHELARISQGEALVIT